VSRVAGRTFAAGAALLIAGCGAVAGATRPPTASRTTAGLSAPAPPATARPGLPAPTPPATARASRPAPAPAPAPASAPATARPATRRAPPTARKLARPSAARHPPFAVGLRVVTFVDRSRRVRFPGGRPAPRRLVTLVRFPATSRGGTPDRAAGPFPLVVFGHGFAVTPRIYAAMLDAWARAGYVVAAPVFPLENADAPGGPNESDLVNQPRDMSLVITRLLTANAVPGGALAGLIAPQAIAVAGQSDGGETALAVAYDRYYRDRRVQAAIILSGAVIPGVGGFDFPAPSPPLLATQGTADTINPPRLTHQFFDLAPRPKYLLTLFGASHLGPYTDAQPQLGIVERVSIAFLDRYLKNAPGAAARLAGAGNAPGTARLARGG
jgi:dienelactone hydrolase